MPEGFVKADVTVGDKRHVVSATDQQLEMLCQARQWYIDATFWVVRPPFNQVFSLHAFL